MSCLTAATENHPCARGVLVDSKAVKKVCVQHSKVRESEVSMGKDSSLCNNDIIIGSNDVMKM